MTSTCALLGSKCSEHRRERPVLVPNSEAWSTRGTGIRRTTRRFCSLPGRLLDAPVLAPRPAELREIVFDIIPRKVSIEAATAAWIIEENRAFYAFLKREFGLKQADACLRVLGGDAVKKLQAALSDRRKFGMAKSLVMAGRDAGFDTSSKEGIGAWMRKVQSQSLPASMELPSLGAVVRPAERAAARARKNQRKAARKARRNNR
jgi:hypothetical protein